MTRIARRLLLGLTAVALLFPTIISTGAIAFSFIPGLNVGVQPLTLFMAAAAGVGGVFFFVFLFGAPIAVVVGAVAYGVLLATQRPGSSPRASRAVAFGGLAGAILLPPVWTITGAAAGIIAYVGPVVLGGVAGAVAGAVFWYIVIRPRPAAAG